jgi:dipeptidyl aminopeptidase/acylaminoacyl peptidase
LLIHGNRDRRVDADNSEKMKKALEKQGKSVKYLNFRRAGHGVYDERERKMLYTNMVEFLEGHLK